MRVAQKFAGYSLAEADNLRKAMGKKVREVMAKARDGFEAGVVRTGYGDDARQGAVRHHREVRRLRVQQEPHASATGWSRTRPPTSRRTTRSSTSPACSQRQDQPRQGGRLSERLPVDGHQGADARHQSVGHRTSTRCRPTRCPTTCPLAVGSPGAITFGLSAVRNVGEALVEQLLAERDENGQFTSVLRLRRAGARAGAQQAHGRVVDQGRRVRLARPHAARRCSRCSNRSSTRRSSAAVKREGRDEPVRRLGRRRERRRGRRRSGDGFDERIPIPDIEFDKSDKLQATRRRCSGCTCPIIRCSASRRRCRRKVEHVAARPARRWRTAPTWWSAA